MQSLIFHIFWAMTFASSFYALDSLDQFFDSDRVVIASLEKQAGSARVRPLDLSLWRDLGENHNFFEGDVISTGMGSYAKIKFRNGRILELDENSLISLTMSESSDNSGLSSILVTLIQGNIASKSVKPSASKKRRQKIKFKSGQTKFDLASAKTGIQLSKSSKAIKAAIKVTSGQVTVQRAGKATKNLKKNESIGKLETSKMLASLGGNFLKHAGSASAFVPASVQAPEIPVEFQVTSLSPEIDKPKEVLIIPQIGDMPKIVWPRPGTFIWSQKSLKMKKIDGLRVAMSMPRRNIEMSWKPIVKLGSNKNTKVFEAKTRNGKPYQYFSAKQLLKNSKKTKKSNIQNYAFDIQTGIEIDNLSTGPGDEKNFSGKKIKINMRSFADLPSGGYSVRVASIRSKRLKKNEWVEQSASKLPRGSGTEILVNSKRQFLSLIPLLNGSNRFEIVPKSVKFKGPGTYLVKNKRIIAKISGRNIGPTAAKSVGRLLGSNLIFSGNARALIPGVSDFIQLKSSAGRYGGVNNFYLLDSGILVPVKRSLIQKDPKAIASLFENVDTFFIEKVTIVSTDR